MLNFYEKLRNSKIKSLSGYRDIHYSYTISYPTAIILAKKNDHVVAIPPNK